MKLTLMLDLEIEPAEPWPDKVDITRNVRGALVDAVLAPGFPTSTVDAPEDEPRPYRVTSATTRVLA